MKNWVSNHEGDLSDGARAKFYVALTRAKSSSAIIYDFEDEENIDGTVKFQS